MLEGRFGAVLFRGFGFLGAHHGLLRTRCGLVKFFNGLRSFRRFFNRGRGGGNFLCGFRGSLFGFFLGFGLFAFGAFGGFPSLTFGAQASFLLGFGFGFFIGFHRRLQNFQAVRLFTVQPRSGIGTNALDISVSIRYKRTLFADFDLNGFVAAARHALMHAVHIHRFFQPQSGTGKSQRSSFVFIVSVCHR